MTALHALLEGMAAKMAKVYCNLRVLINALVASLVTRQVKWENWAATIVLADRIVLALRQKLCAQVVNGETSKVRQAKQ